jgi:cell wall-associated NlpC family hydrolase
VTARTKVMVLVALAVVALVPLVPAAPARGDEIGDLRTRAAQITAQMADLQSQIRSTTTEVEKARYRATQLESEIADKQKSLLAARRSESAARRQLSEFALRAYVSGGRSSGIDVVLGTKGDQLGQRNGYVSAAVGDRQQLVDEFSAAQKVTREQASRLEADQREAKATEARAEAKQNQAQQAAQELASIQRQLDGRLATLVAEQQAAQARAAEQRIRAQAAAQEAAAARQSAARQQASSAAALPPVSSPSQGSPNPPASDRPAFVPPPNASAAAIAIAAARSQLGVPYSWGGGDANGPTYGIAQGANTRGFDCSGLTLYAYAQAGITLSHLTWDQMRQGQVVPLSQIQPGDLVFYWGGGHMALYVGGGQVIHAPQTGDVVRYGSLYMGPPELVVRPSR